MIPQRLFALAILTVCGCGLTQAQVAEKGQPRYGYLTVEVRPQLSKVPEYVLDLDLKTVPVGKIIVCQAPTAGITIRRSTEEWFSFDLTAKGAGSTSFEFHGFGSIIFAGSMAAERKGVSRQLTISVSQEHVVKQTKQVCRIEPIPFGIP
jgi:hypothetical protein